MNSPILRLHQDMSRVMSGDLSTCYFCGKVHSRNTNCHPMDLIDMVRDLREINNKKTEENDQLKDTIDHQSQIIQALQEREGCDATK